MFSFLKDMRDKATAEASKWRDKETAEAMVAVMCAVAHADGALEAQEKAKFASMITTHPILKQFDRGVLVAKWNDLCQLYELDADIGHDAALKELTDVSKNSPEQKRIAIIRLGVAAAKADGDFEAEERLILVRCCQALAVSPADIGL